MNYDNPDMSIGNLDTSLVYDKTGGLTITDPHHLMKDAKFDYTNDGKYVYFNFSFIANQKMPKSNVILTIWDQSNRVNQVHLLNALQLG
jgi:hypothetical protein